MPVHALDESSRLHQVQAKLESGTLQRSGVLLNALTTAETAHLLESRPLTEKRILRGLDVNLITAFLTSWVIGNFQGTIEKVVALASLIQMVASMGRVAGPQTMTLAIRGIALGQLSSANMRWLVVKEFGVGMINSLDLGRHYHHHHRHLCPRHQHRLADRRRHHHQPTFSSSRRRYYPIAAESFRHRP